MSITKNQLKDYSKLLQKKYRHQAKQFLIEGFHLVEEALKQGIVLDIFSTTPYKNARVVSIQEIKKLSDTITTPEIIAVCKFVDTKPLGEKVLVLDFVQDPGNLGTLIRSAKAFGFNDILAIGGVDVFSPKVLRSSQGAFFSVNILQTNDYKNYFKDYKVFAASLTSKAIDYRKIVFPKKLMLVLGNEAQGISKEVLKEVDQEVYIPINFESLNVAIAGSILMNEIHNRDAN